MAEDDKKEDVAAEAPESAESPAPPAASADEPDADEPDADEPDADEPDADEPDADEPDADEPDADEPEPKKAVEPELPPRMRAAQPHGLQPTQSPPLAAGFGAGSFLFLLVFGVLAAGFAMLSGNDPFSSSNVPRWRKGQKVQVNITLDPKDDQKLACATKTEIDGKRCEYASKTDKTAGNTDDANLLRPYTTTDGVQFLAAGMWSQPDLEPSRRPSSRFTVGCTLTVSGSIGSPAIRWDPKGAWIEKSQPWFAGSLGDCKLVKE